MAIAFEGSRSQALQEPLRALSAHNISTSASIAPIAQYGHRSPCPVQQDHDYTRAQGAPQEPQNPMTGTTAQYGLIPPVASIATSAIMAASARFATSHTEPSLATHVASSGLVGLNPISRSVAGVASMAPQTFRPVTSVPFPNAGLSSTETTQSLVPTTELNPIVHPIQRSGPLVPQALATEIGPTRTAGPDLEGLSEAEPRDSSSVCGPLGTQMVGTSGAGIPQCMVPQAPTLVPQTPTAFNAATPFGPPRAPDAFSERSTVPLDVWFTAVVLPRRGRGSTPKSRASGTAPLRRPEPLQD